MYIQILLPTYLRLSQFYRFIYLYLYFTDEVTFAPLEETDEIDHVETANQNGGCVSSDETDVDESDKSLSPSESDYEIDQDDNGNDIAKEHEQVSKLMKVGRC